MNKSVATIDAPEFINLQTSDISPFIKQGEVKVLYTGENRNRSYISKEAAERIGKTLRGAPIVGFYKDDVGDFRDHGEKITWDCDDFKFECMTKPYGFVPLDAKVWFQKFVDTNEFGEQIEREYLMTTCYLWAGQFEEANLPLEGTGRPHSMELDDDTLDGQWATNAKGIEFFIINDANITKLCILGLDVEPCFEGSSVTAPNISTSFTKDSKSFIEELREMVRQVENAKKGGLSMTTENIDKSIVEQPNTEFDLKTKFDGDGGEGGEPAGGDGAGESGTGTEGQGTESGSGTEGQEAGSGTEGSGTEGSGTNGSGTEGSGSGSGDGNGDQSNDSDPVADITAIAGQAAAGTIEGDVAQINGQAIVDGVAGDVADAEQDVADAEQDVADAEAALEEAKESGDAEAIAAAEAALTAAETALTTAETALTAEKATQTAVEAQQETIDAIANDQQGSDAAGSGNVVPKESFTALEEKYNALLAEVESLREYKLKIENVERDAIIAKFSMLPEEILKEVSDNKEKYSLKELENHLKILYFDNNVTLEKKQEEKKVEPVTTFNLEGCETQQLPAWLADVKAMQEKINGRN